MEPNANGPEHGHDPAPSLWPVGFAIGIAILLTGLVVSWIVVAIGGAIALVFGFLWARDLLSAEDEEARREAARARQAPAPPPAATAEDDVERFPRSKFLEASTLGFSALIGGLITVPVVGFALAPTFVGQGHEDVDIGGLDDFPENEWRVVTFMENPAEGEVSRRTAFVRYNGQLDGEPSFTIISNRCVHLGCPVQPSGPTEDDQAEEVTVEGQLVVRRIPTNPAAFACPCHGGAYDKEGNRTSGPPVRALDRYEYKIEDGRVILTSTFSVGSVEGEGAEAIIIKYDNNANPGVHVDGPEQVLYPIYP